jgi:hypothetical protein
MRGGKENADRSKEVWPRTECILFFQVIPCLKMLYELNPNKQKQKDSAPAAVVSGRGAVEERLESGLHAGI